MIVRSQSLAPLFSLLHGAGVDVARLRERYRLPAAAETELDYEVSADRLQRLFEEAVRLTDNRNLGLLLASRLERGRYGVLEYVALHSATFADALGVLVRFSRLINSTVRYELERSGTEARLRQHLGGRRDGLGAQLNEFNLSALLKMARGILRQRWCPTRIWFAHQIPGAERARLEESFGTSRVRYGASTNGLAFDAQLLALPVPDADPALLSILTRTALGELSQLPNDDSVVARASTVLRTQIRTGAPPRLSTVARALHMSGRTLQRRLMADELSFLDLVDQVREADARELLSAGTAQVSEVAFLLGFQDPHSFARAFKRWTGLAPHTFRERACA